MKLNRLIKKGMAVCACLGMLVVTPGTTFAADLPEKSYYTLTILHTNDIHGHVDQLPQYATIINQVRSESDHFLLLDGGDIFLRGEFEEYQGQVEMALLNVMGYDAWVLGNNDFRVPPAGGTTQQGNQQLQALIEQAEFPTLCANVTMKSTGKYIDQVDPYLIKEVDGVKVGIIGVTSLKPQDRKWTENSDKIFTTAEATVQQLITEVESKSDISLVLSHAGLALDLKIANIPGVTAVLGADDHYRLAEPMYNTYLGKKSTPITQNGGEENHYLGRLDLVYQQIDGKLQLVDFRGDLYDLALVKGDPEIQGIIEQYRSQQEKAA